MGKYTPTTKELITVMSVCVALPVAYLWTVSFIASLFPDDWGYTWWGFPFAATAISLFILLIVVCAIGIKICLDELLK